MSIEISTTSSLLLCESARTLLIQKMSSSNNSTSTKDNLNNETKENNENDRYLMYKNELSLLGTQSNVTVSTCNLNQWALDFEGNLERIIESIKIAKSRNSILRIGPELEICGYGCEDHFLESDTIHHCWQSIEKIIKGKYTNGILCSFGMPVIHNDIIYNCNVWIYNKTNIS